VERADAHDGGSQPRLEGPSPGIPKLDGGYFASTMSFKGAVNRATDNPVLQRIARAGYLISGLLHLLVASIIVRIALGSTGEADQTGALAKIGRASCRERV